MDLRMEPSPDFPRPRKPGWFLTHRVEIFAGVIAGIVSMSVYAWSAAPNVTLLDSGEFVVAAQHFGVPHPTGYPLWTLLTWLFLLLPLGNAAWEVNLFSGVCSALAVALTAGVLTNLLRWFLGEMPGRNRWIAPLVGVAFALMLAFSVSMWSQAVIAEVYGLHALMTILYLSLLYAWARNPARDGFMLAAFFALALSFSNHHLTLTLAPLPYLLILLLRRRALADWILAGVLTALLGYLGFAILSNNEMVLKTAIRFFWIALVAGLGFVVWRRFRVRWHLVAFLPFVVAVGLLPYAYMPLASSTNPPMNWSYARDPAGFFYSINRSQYAGNLADQSLRTLGRITGTTPENHEKPAGLPRRPRLQGLQLWVGFFWQQLARAFTPFSVIGYFASILFILRCSLPKRAWIYTLHFAFVLAAFLQPAMDGAEIDLAGWWLQMPYHTYTNLIYALLSGLGTGLLIEFLTRRRRVYFWLAPVLLVFPVWTLLGSEASASQRGRWFGWMFGHDMLKDLPRNSIVIGGTDPGRFVPTYMIFGESGQPGHRKRDPDFDRRDLYIITQNALAETFYMQYLRDHYGPGRPQPKNAFERWLGRENTYPKQPLTLPSPEEVKKIIESELAKEGAQQGAGEPPSGQAASDSYAIFSETLRWIWEHNRDEHDFFIEESFPIRWTYDYATPHGLVYQLHREKVPELTPEMVAKDFAFWADYKARLLGDPAYHKDLDAQRSFSSLRMTMGNIYRHRKMLPEAERTFREAIELSPVNVNALSQLSEILMDRGDYDEAMELLDAAYGKDPNSLAIVSLAAIIQRRKESHREIEKFRKALEIAPADGETFSKLLRLYTSIGDTNNANALIGPALETFRSNASVLTTLSSYLEVTGQRVLFLKAAEQLAAAAPGEAMHHYILARARLLNAQTNEAYQSMTQAVRGGGRNVRELLAQDPVFAGALEKPPFSSLLKQNPASFPAGEPPAIPKE